MREVRLSRRRMLFGLLLLGAPTVVVVCAAGPGTADRITVPETRAEPVGKKPAGSLIQLFREGMSAEPFYGDFHSRDGRTGIVERKPEDCLTQNLRWKAPVSDAARVRKMLDDGADVNERDERGATPLIYAAANSTLEIVRLLLDRGADIDAADKFGETALLAAVYDRSRSDIARELVSRGADVNIVSVYGETALAKCHGDREMVHLLLEHGAKVDGHALTYTAYVADIDPAVIGEMLDTGVDVDLRGDQGRSALMCAAYSDNVPLIKELLRRGAKANVVDDEDMGIIQYSGCATPAKDATVVRLLRQAGARR